MSSFVLGVFPSVDSARGAVETLKNVGYTNEEISVLVKDNAAAGAATTTADPVAAGAATGITTGGALGALGGLLVGLGALTIPGIGPILAGGPLLASLGITGAAATTVTGAAAGAATGAVAGGLMGALVSRGVPEAEAQMYEQRLKDGAALVGVVTDRITADTAAQTLTAQGAETVSRVA